ncbi:hypothetical protein B0T10DRAFT_497715 [Thelonectria olida]|uniref:Uncharacterized protein n=1 Tax=Thelonectria olida TaxID=1576542 RepID=A0A9P8VVP8_9HYPO|nr:hypothetical protein B0T10DRAFT_497715 [Thelonectria olida]
MSQSYWDPANLLQVTLDQNDTWGEIQCVGVARSRHNNRCRWTIEDPDRAKVRPLLVQMSKTKPELITTDTLRKLAILCLCPSYHSGQVSEAVARWTLVVKTAAQHHKNLVGSAASASTNGNASLETALKEAQQKLVDAQKTIDAEKTSAAQFAARTMGTTNQLRSEATSWMEKYNKVQDEKDIQITKIAQLHKSLRTLEDGLKEEKSPAAQSATATMGTIDELRAKVTASDAAIEELKEHNEILEEMIEQQDTDHDEEMEALRNELIETTAQLETSRTEKEALDVTISGLKESKQQEIDRDREIESLQKQLEEATAQLETSRKEKEALQATISESKQLKQQEIDQEGEIETLRKELDEVTAQLQASLIEDEARGATISGLKQSNQALQESIEKLSTSRVAEEDELQTMRAKQEETSALVLELRAQRDEARTQTQVLDAQIEALQKDDAAADKVLNKLKLEISKSEKLTTKLTAEISSRDRSLGQCRTELEAERARIGHLETTISDLQTRHVEASQSNAADEKSRAGLEENARSLCQHQADLERQRTRIADLESKVVRLEASEASLKGSISACWLHGLGTLFSRSGKRSRSKKSGDDVLSAA